VCGRRLIGNDPSATLPTQHLPGASAQIHQTPSWGTTNFERNARIVMHIRDASEVIEFEPEKRMLIGRLDSSSLQKPDLDLTPYGALEKGVSRIHAAIYRNDETLTVVDMGSANGTHLNGQRLSPDVPRVLRDGDELRLGKLVAHIYFKV
jgi:pSer/pThr/pTyr-binding forkhead associated (FHA) protein